jgi:hypothetical protein
MGDWNGPIGILTTPLTNEKGTQLFGFIAFINHPAKMIRAEKFGIWDLGERV